MASHTSQRKWLLIPLFLTLALVLAIVLRPQLSGTQHLENFSIATASVQSVHDGDTFRARVEGSTERIRLIGVDTPELDASDEHERQAAQEATAFARALIDGKQVWLVIETAGRTDHYDRILAYVWLTEPPTTEQEMRQRILTDTLNGQLITSGNAKPLSIEPQTTFASTFEEAARAS